MRVDIVIISPLIGGMIDIEKNIKLLKKKLLKVEEMKKMNLDKDLLGDNYIDL